jgi:hypothetical protein
MQGRQGPDRGNDPKDRSGYNYRPSLDGASRQRGVPQRPPRMARVDTPPQMPRVERPQRPAPPKRRGRRLLFILGGIIILVMLVFIIAYGLTNYFIGIGGSQGAATTAANFLGALESQDYDTVYHNYLDARLTVSMQPDDFKAMAQLDDKCFGKVTDYNEVSGSAKISPDGNQQSYTYMITRSRLSKPYSLTLTLQKQSDGSWDVSDYGGDLGPSTPGPNCQ